MGDTRNQEVKESLLAKESSTGDFQVYTYRWVVLFVYVLGKMANGIILPTWTTIAYKANDYWGGIGMTSVNLLILMFSVVGLPGTAVALRVSERNGPRNVMLCGVTLSTVGCVVRALGAIMREQIGPNGSFAFILIGTALVGLSQPFYTNMPAKLTATWFSINERDIAMAGSTISMMISVAVGSLLPPFFTSGVSVNEGIQNLLITQFAIVFGASLLIFIFFRDEPPTPPSESAKKMSEIARNSNHIYNQQRLNKQLLSDGGRTMSAARSMSVDLLAHKTMLSEVKTLFSNPEYLKLCIVFSLSVGVMGGTLSLIGQLPTNYADSDIGLGASLVSFCGIVGCFLCGYMLDKTKAYRTIYKVTTVAALVAFLFFISNCRDDRLALFMFSAGLFGFCVVPSYPATICCAVECTFPAPAEAAVGCLMVGSSVLSIIITFLGQYMLSLGGGHHNAPFYPFGYFMISLMVAACIPALMFNGQYLRLNEDRAVTGLNNVAAANSNGDYNDEKQEYFSVNVTEEA